jgi:hypothetical protein
MKQRVIFVDVDGHLSSIDRSQAHSDAAGHLAVREPYDAGMAIYLWSSGGAEYARSSAAEPGIEHASKRSCQNPTVTSMIRLSMSGATAGMCFH